MGATNESAPDISRSEDFWDFCLKLERIVRHLRALKNLGHHEEHRLHEVGLVLRKFERFAMEP